ncbi:HAD-superfamily hydrolase [Xylariaceae sp. FL1272]|nr:HAD-superfamily hydrolase [Xylariaceae sp. FL1272]
MDKSLTSFTTLSFDVYATLIDWETGIYTALAPLNDRLPESHALKNNRRGLLVMYTYFEGVLEHRYPDMKYAQLLGEVYMEMAAQLGIPLDPSLSSTDEEKVAFGSTVGIWPAFPDTVEALRVLGKRYKLIVLSNVDRESFERTRTGPLQGIQFDAVYTAQEIGSYKPDVRNFEYMIQHARNDLGVGKEGFLHTAQALKHDHVPAKKAGLKSCWIERAGDEAVIGVKLGDFGKEVELAYRFKTLGDMAEAVETAFGCA